MRTAIPSLLVAVLLMMSAYPAMAQTDIIVINTGVFITQINSWMPIAMEIASDGLAIVGAIIFCGCIGAVIINALRGRIGM